MTSQIDSFDGWVRQADALRAELGEAQSRFLQTEVSGTAGPVTVWLGATGDLRDIRIQENQVADMASLQRDILAAHERAAAAVRERATELVRPLQSLIESIEHIDSDKL